MLTEKKAGKKVYKLTDVFGEQKDNQTMEVTEVLEATNQIGSVSFSLKYVKVPKLPSFCLPPVSTADKIV